MILASIVCVCVTLYLVAAKTLAECHDVFLLWLESRDGGSAVQDELQAVKAQLGALEDRHAELSAKTRQAMGWK